MLTYFNESTPKDQVFTIASYNLENLYDVFDDPITQDDDFTPKKDKHWNLKKYVNKIENLGEVIIKIGLDHSLIPPIVIGVYEVENERVLMDLVNSKPLKPFHYGYVHYDSPDHRGIDVAFLYQKEHFELLDSKPLPLLIFDNEGKRDFTRDILLVKGNFNGELMYFIVNHWPSRREGAVFTEPKRIIASQTVQEIIQNIITEDENAKIVVMGDFNDNPLDKSIKNLVTTCDLYNPMESLKDKSKGTSYSEKTWYLFDQIIFSKNFFEIENSKHTLKYADVYNTRFINTWKGKRKNTPFRTYIGKWHQGGFSDHFPVMAYLERS